MDYGRYTKGPFTFRTWECCGQRWHTILSPSYPDREYFFPECPLCGEMGDWPLDEEYESINPPTKVDLTYAPKCSPFTGRRT